MKKVIRLTESDLVRLVKKVISENSSKSLVNEQLGTDESPTKKILEGYSNKLSNILKGKTFNVVTKSSDGKYVHPVIKFTGFADRDHTQDNQLIQNIKIFI